MGADSHIEWTNATWNPGHGLHTDLRRLPELLRETDGEAAPRHGKCPLSERFQNHDPRRSDRPSKNVEAAAANFCESMSDLFHDDVPVTFIQKVLKRWRIARAILFRF